MPETSTQSSTPPAKEFSIEYRCELTYTGGIEFEDINVEAAIAGLRATLTKLSPEQVHKMATFRGADFQITRVFVNGIEVPFTQ